MSTPLRFGPEFLVNTTTVGPQAGPTITGLANGRFVASWSDLSKTGGDTSEIAVRAQVFNADGSKTGPEFLVNTTTLGDQAGPKITDLANGGFVISWSDKSQTGDDTSDWAIRAQVFDEDGAPSGGEFLVNTTTSKDQIGPTITGLTNGDFVISWTDESETGEDTSLRAVRAQVFNSDGSPKGDEFLVNTSTYLAQQDPTVTSLANGGFVISWEDSGKTGIDTSRLAVRAQIFNADGTPKGREFLVNTTTSEDQENPTITGLANGGFVVSWTDDSRTGADTSGSAIRAQVFSDSGDKVGGEFLVNTTTSSFQFGASVANLTDGRFVISWSGNSQMGDDTLSFAVRAQVFNADGTRAGEEFVVNTTTSSAQFDSEVSGLADGRFVITWRDDSISADDASGMSVRGQIFDPRETAVTLNGTLLDDDYEGTRFGDQLFGFLGDDDLSGNGGDDNLYGQAGRDTLKGGGGNDRLYGGTGGDKLAGGNGFDQLFGEGGADILNGGFGVDYMVGGTGDDIYTVDVTGDVVIELANQGTDTVRSATLDLNLASYANIENLRLLGAADLDLVGNNGANLLRGNSGANIVKGKSGNDILKGLAGADTLNGGQGRDFLFGGTGADTFVFTDITDSGTTNATRDRIRDFSQAEGDLIDLSAIDAASASGDQSFSFLGIGAFTSTEGEVRYQQIGLNTFVQVDLDGNGTSDFELKLNGLHTLSELDFVL